MTGPGPSPADTARFDQDRAALTADMLREVDHIRRHVAEHDGDTACAFACAAANFVLHPFRAVTLLAAALVHIATTTEAQP